MDPTARSDGAMRPRATWVPDLIVAVLLAAVLSAMSAAIDWSDLSHLLLPDNDDMMRLAQVRDWLAGQGINDWTQYRVAPPRGSSMHWSRVNDVGLAGLILGFTPFVGRAGAELAAILLYPPILFAIHLFLSGRIGRRIWGGQAAAIAILLAGLAYPGTTVFVPGRIDHHALQVVLIDVAILAMIGRARFASGLVAGGAIALALVIGLETAPQLAMLIASLGIFWIIRGGRERDRLMGTAAGLALTTLPFVLFLRPTLWTSAYCDAFTPASSNATLAGAAVLGLLASATPALRSWQVRMAAAGALGGAMLLALVLAYPACLAGPYGQVDPFLRREFFVHINEANSIFQASPGRGLQYGGLMFAAMAGIGWVAWRRPRRWRRWLPSAAVVAISGAITLAQVRGTYIGTPLSAPLLAGIVLAARLRRPQNIALLAGAWLGCSGMGWYAAPLVADMVTGPARTGGGARITQAYPTDACLTPQTWDGINRYPPGVVMAPVSVASYLTGATGMSTVGAGYHRNDRGTMAMYRYFLSPPDRAAAIARQWGVRYVAFCPGDFREMDAARRFPNSLVALLDAGRAPRDFRPLPLQGTRLRLYRLP